MVFHLPLRQTKGFLDSLLRLRELDLKAPDHTTLSRRNKDVDVPRPPCPPCPTLWVDRAASIGDDTRRAETMKQEEQDEDHRH